jgi:hypothetical protein
VISNNQLEIKTGLAWEKTPDKPLCYKPSQVYSARFNAKGKFIRRSLKTSTRQSPASKK